MTNAPTVAEVLAHRVRKYRQERGWSVRQLAEECGKRGAGTLTQASLTNIERGLTPGSTRGSRAVTVQEMLTLAAVLQVPPIMLMLPFGEENMVEVCPGVGMEPWAAAKWIYGSSAQRKAFDQPEPESGYGDFERTASIITGVTEVLNARQRAHDYHQLLNVPVERLRKFYRIRDHLQLAPAADLSEDEWVVRAREVVPELYEARLREYADLMWRAHNSGIRVPTVPKHLYDAIMALPAAPKEAEGESRAVLGPAPGEQPILPPGLQIEVYDGDR